MSFSWPNERLFPVVHIVLIINSAAQARLTTTLCYPLEAVIGQPSECVLIIFVRF